MFINRYFLGSLGFSLFVHLCIFGTIKYAKPRVREVQFDEIREVTFYDPSQRPEVAAAVGGGGGGSAAPRATGSGGGGGGVGGGGGGQAYMPAIPGYKDLTDDQVAPLSVASRLSGTQASVDVGKFATDDMAGMDVIHLADRSSGKTASTDEILSAQPLALARGVAGSGGGGGSGYAPYLPGGAGSSPQLQPEELPQPTISKQDLSKRIERSHQEMQQEAPTQEKMAAAPANKPSVTISGQIAQRKRIRAGLPRYPEWAIKQGASGTVVIKLFVSADGTVRENLTIESTSGYPALDELVANALRGWQFGPLDPGVPQDDQWGRITVRFVLG